MTLERINELYANYSNAVKRLGEALKIDVKKGSIAVDGTIQRYEFTFELAWKLLKCILEYNGIQSVTPRLVVKEAYKAGIITDGDEWIDMLEDRNKTVHIYDEAQALAIYKKIKKQHFRQLEMLRGDVRKTAKSLRES
ncbi:MAG: nucleotidyltransferase substrate binding protein [Candidatus Omnitrophica bacterium]|nr:nucleotidyltransferase substrate binding protein [Candidatus Omnitrophota bacterium]MBU1127619.1 nucleotidyltransferase substrate binding protein [Candidatus Omnitrophota bacterium]MBU1784571.1 nucleotidyltransferase substrate binding protein [Candidatus Omnitrophota bacterium]MBU1850852.1 nucleotidyltransferase substrate binding protein [Candidatus Omnitrophota bacterium]